MYMTRKELKEYAELLSGYSLQYFMLDKMNRDIDMECPMTINDENNPHWEDYIEEVIDWLEKDENLTDSIMCIVRYSKTENTERFGRNW